MPDRAINSAYDDFGLVIAPAGDVGYFASNRPGTGSDDIYKLTIVQLSQQITGIVVDHQTGLPVPGARVTLLDCDDHEIAQLAAAGDGRFGTETVKGGCILARAEAAGYEPGEKAYGDQLHVEIRLRQVPQHRFRVTDLDNGDILAGAVISCGDSRWTTGADGMVSVPVSVTKGCTLRVAREGYLDQTIVLTAEAGQGEPAAVKLMKKELNRTFTLENIYYDLNRWEILPASAAELDKLVAVMRDNPTLSVELGSHTDSRGSDAYNLRLSQQRSESAVAWIIQNGIPADRITARGYGETQLVNQCANGVTCPDEEHRKNRRTEFKITGF
jgi:outer membrane protein OmpA-like peptidoglycan-associated protein